MIFDECHHARKNHPYNGILREYFHVEASLRPKVFGMTASPVWNTKNPQTSIEQLESNMNAKVIGIQENISELEEKSPKPEEVSQRMESDISLLTWDFSVSRAILSRHFLMTARSRDYMRAFPSSIKRCGNNLASHFTLHWRIVI
jgi:superfamily II DNA or RNA helicase